jgi:hypothetical protein
MFLVRQRVCVFVSVCVHGCAFACVVLRVVWVYATGQCRW